MTRAPAPGRRRPGSCSGRRAARSCCRSSTSPCVSHRRTRCAFGARPRRMPWRLRQRV
jgi:hypothetical protein